MILKGGIPGVIAKPGPGVGHGITPAQIGTAGNAASPLVNDIDPGDETTEFLFVLVPPVAASGSTLVSDRGGYSLVGPAEGVYTQAYRVLYMPQSGLPGSYSAEITITVGSGGAAGAAGPRYAVRRSTGEVLTLVLDESGRPYAARRANGALLSLSVLGNESLARALLDSGELVILL